MNRSTDTLMELALFSGVDRANIEKMLADPGTHTEKYLKGDVIFEGSRDSGVLGVILSGRAVVNNNSTSMRRMNAGSVFGVVSLFGGSGAGTRIAATTACRVLYIPEPAVEELIMNSPKAAMNYIRFLTDRINFLNTVVDRYTGQDVTANLKAYLLAKSKSDGSVFNASVTDIARRLNVGRRSVYRSLDKLVREGAVSREGKTITVTDAGKLK